MVGDACELLVQVVPNASRTAVAGLHGDALRVRLMAPPIDGRANAALVAWLAEQLSLPRRDVMLLAGETQRRKRIGIALEAGRLCAWVNDRLAVDRDGR